MLLFTITETVSRIELQDVVLLNLQDVVLLNLRCALLRTAICRTMCGKQQPIIIQEDRPAWLIF